MQTHQHGNHTESGDLPEASLSHEPLSSLHESTDGTLPAPPSKQEEPVGCSVADADHSRHSQTTQDISASPTSTSQPADQQTHVPLRAHHINSKFRRRSHSKFRTKQLLFFLPGIMLYAHRRLVDSHSVNLLLMVFGDLQHHCHAVVSNLF